MTTTHWLVIASGVFAVLYALYAGRTVLAADTGSERMREISAAVQEGANAYLNRQYQAIAIVGVVVLVLTGVLIDWLSAIGFLVGAVLSGATGYIGMNVSVRANVRTAHAASLGLQQGLSISFQAGAVTGMLVAGLALLAVSGYYAVLLSLDLDVRDTVTALVALGFGGSLISIFARLGGGIFTKGADVGADLVGKVEAGIPEDDPRNPAVIADNVGDNVGDCAGMAADLFETYAVTVVATMVLASIFFTGELQSAAMILPLAMGGACIITSVVGTFFVRLGSSNSIMGALYKGFLATAILSAIAFYPVISNVVGMDTVLTAGATIFTGMDLFWCSVLGLVVTGLLIWVTEYYTGTIYETFLDELPNIGSICSGGRYDNLAELYTRTALPGVGASLGLDRLLAAMQELEMVDKIATHAEVFVVYFDGERLHDYLQLAADLRNAGLRVEFYSDPKKISQQLKYANRRGHRLAVIAGSREFESATCQLKNLDSGDSQAVSLADGPAELVAAIRRQLAE